MCGVDHIATLFNPRMGEHFLEPIELNLQLADLGLEILLLVISLDLVADLGRGLGEDLRQPGRHLFLQLADLDRMDLVSLGDYVDRLDSLEGFETYFGFEISARAFQIKL